MTEKLNFKQFSQVVSLCVEFQPYTHTETVVFLEVVYAAREFCEKYRYPFCISKEVRFDKVLIGRLISEIKNKYYFNGIKYANGRRKLTNEQYLSILEVCSRANAGIGISDRPIAEKELFMKVVRACRDYMRAKMSKEAEPAFYENLNVVQKAKMN